MNKWEELLNNFNPNEGVNEMKKFKITIEETVSQDFEIEATSLEEAMDIAEAKYNNGEFVLEPGNLVCKQMMGEDEDGYCTEWCEF
jgi:hypothetical protein